jgi:hypothetical protein
MSRLPNPGQDDGTWGFILNDFLDIEHNPDGSLKLRTDPALTSKYTKPGSGIPATDLDASSQTKLAQAASAYQKPGAGIPETDLNNATQAKIDASATAYQKPAPGIPSTDMTSAVQTSLSKADTALQSAPVSSVNGKTGTVILSASDVGAPTTLAGDSDVTVTTPSDGQVLTYNTASSTWKNQAAPSAPVTSVAGKTGAVTLTEADIASLTSDLAATEKIANKGTASGYAPLDATSKVPTTNLGGAGADATKFLRGDQTWTTPPAAPVTSVAGRTGAVTLTSADVGLGNVDNTSDVSKPVSTATQTALNGKVDTTRQVTAGTGLTGGGDLTADRTFAVAYGTTAGTAAQGNDGRFAGAAAGTAGASLAATDASVTNSRSPSGNAGGDLSGIYPNPTVAKVNGITVTGTPSSGQILTASSTSTASWAPAPSTPSDWFNVKTYGAKGDNSTDDTSSIQSAITAAAGGGTLYFPAGTYKHTGLTLSSKLTIIGAGIQATTLKLTNDTAHALHGSNVDFITIRDIAVFGSSDGLSLGSFDGIRLDVSDSTPTQNVKIENVYVNGFSRHGVSIDDPITSLLTNVRAQTCGGYGFNINVGTSLTFQSCYANSCFTGGYNLQNVSYSQLQACACDNSGIGYQLNTCKQVVLTGCGDEAPTGTQYLLTGGAGNTLTSCYASGNAGVAFQLMGGESRAVLINCRETAPSGSATASISVASGCSATVMISQVVTASSYAANTTNSFDTSNLQWTTPGTTSIVSDRGLTTNFSSFILARAGVSRWALQNRNDSTDDLHVYNANRGFGTMLIEDRATMPNMSLLTNTKSYGGGIGVVYMPNANTVPTTNPTGGAIVYMDSGVLKWRDTAGNVYTLDGLTNPNALPEEQSQLGWSFDPALSSANLAPSGAGVLQLMRLKVPKASTITNLLVNVTVAGATLTNSYAALYNAAGTQQGVSTDQSTPWTSTGVKTIALGSPVAVTAGTYYAAILVATATTLPQFRGGSGTVGTANAGITTAPFRCGTIGSSLTAAPASYTPSSMSTNNFPFWVGLS